MNAAANSNVLSDTDGSLVSQAMKAISDHIRDEQLKLGFPIPSEAAFALKVGVSRAVVREAFRSLAAVGVIEIGNGRRARVGGIDETVLPIIQQIYDVRRTVEMRTVALAALRRTNDEALEISRLAAAMDRDFDTPVVVKEHDIAFHEAISRASKNPLFSLLVSSFRVVTQQTWHIAWHSRPSDVERRDSMACHMKIADAIVRQDTKDATAYMAEHFDNSVKALLAAGVT